MPEAVGIPLHEAMRQAHKYYTQNEPRAFVYDVATRERSRSMLNSVLLLLLVWNREAYLKMKGGQYFRFLHKHKRELASAIDDVAPRLQPIQNLTLESISLPENVELIAQCFIRVFQVERVGATAASKILHILLPSLFVMWDEKIRKGYGILDIEKSEIRKLGKAERAKYYSKVYVDFLGKMQNFAQSLIDSGDVTALLRECDDATLPKLLDEYNYCIHTLRWKPSS